MYPPPNDPNDPGTPYGGGPHGGNQPYGGYPPPTNGRNGKTGLIIGLVVGLVLLLLVCGGGAFLLANAGDDDEPNPTPSSSSQAPQPSVEPSTPHTDAPSPSPTGNDDNQERIEIRDDAVATLLDLHKHASAVGFPGENFRWRYLAEEEDAVTCGSVRIDPSEATGLPTFFCVPDNTFYFKEAAVRKILQTPLNGLTGKEVLKAVIVNSYALAAANQRETGVTVNRRACSFGVLFKGEVRRGLGNVTTFERSRSVLYDAGAASDAATDGYNNGTAAFCDRY